MLDRLTSEATQVLALAEEEARRLGHNYVGTEQLLVGLLLESTGVAARVLKSFGLRPKLLRHEMKSIIGMGSGWVAKSIPHTPRLKNVLSNSTNVARALRSRKVSTEHLLLALLKEPEGVGIRILSNLAIKSDTIEARVQQALNNDELPADPIREPPVKDTPMLPNPEPYSDDEEEALDVLLGSDNFMQTNDVPPEMLQWLKEEIGPAVTVFGVYMNAEDDYLIICSDRLYWYDGAVRTLLEYDSVASVSCPTTAGDPYLKLVLRPKNDIVMLPVIHETEGTPDFMAMYEYLYYAIIPAHREPRKIVKIQEIGSREDFIAFLRQPGMNANRFDRLAAWLERGGPSESWLTALEISPTALDDPNAWRLIASMLIRFPETVGKP